MASEVTVVAAKAAKDKDENLSLERLSTGASKWYDLFRISVPVKYDTQIHHAKPYTCLTTVVKTILREMARRMVR